MEANELRIGNRILYNNTPAYVTAGLLEQLSNSKGALNIEGISITPEILAKAGYKIYEKGITFNKWEHEDLGKNIIQSCGFYMTDVLPELKYVHQLQNIYYFRMGKELKIEL